MKSQHRPRALVVAYDFPPHAAIGTMRTLRVVQQLAREDWDVTVLTSDPATFRAGTPSDGDLVARIPASVRVIRAASFRGFERLKTAVRPPRPQSRAAGSPTDQSPSSTGRVRPREKNFLGRAIDTVDAALAIPDQESAWLVPAIARGLAHCRAHRPDVLYSSAPPWTGQLVARALSAAVRCPWVADFRDPWSRAPWREHRPKFVQRASAALERLVVQRADAVLFVTEGNRNEFETFYGSDTARRFEVIPNGCDPSEFERAVAVAPPADRFVLLHAGSLYAGRNPLPLMRAAANAIRRGAIDPTRFRLRLLGQITVPGVDLRQAIADLGLTDVVECVARVPREQSIAEMMSASALLLVQPVTTVSVPGKLYEYFAVGRPILALTAEGETAEIVRASGNGVVVPADDEPRIEAGLLATIDLASRAPVKIAPSLYDGRIGAARTTALLRRFAVSARASGTSWNPAAAPEIIASSRSEETAG